MSHTFTLTLSSGATAQVHHNSDWSGEASITHAGASYTLPGELVQAMVEKVSGPIDPWAGVALVTFSTSRILSIEAGLRVKAQLEQVIRPHTGAPVLILEEGGTLHLHGTNPRQPVGVLALSPEDVGLHAGGPLADAGTASFARLCASCHWRGPDNETVCCPTARLCPQFYRVTEQVPPRAGDTVFHRPSGETWQVRRLVSEHGTEDRVEAYGWPHTQAPLSDCALVRACSDEEHERILREGLRPARDGGAAEEGER